MANEDVGKYGEFGYCLVRGIVPQGDLEELRKDILEAISEFKKNPVYPKIKATEYRDYAPGLHLHKPSVVALLRSAPMADLVRTLIGPDADLRFTTTMTKTAERSESFDWHQDDAYGADPEHPKLTCWFAISDSMKADGCLRIIEKSHHQGLVKHVDSRLHFPDKEIEVVNEADAMDVEMHQGDMIMMSPLLFHSSWPNTSGNTRIALLAGFMKPKMDYLEFERKASYRYLRGSETRWERVGNG
jgi:ectoine hydroxylase-related dioxygenase (phytanoyl-CoA dioxygenase family)